MRLDSARSLKQSLLDEMISPFVALAARAASFAVAAQPHKEVPNVHRAIALGVAPVRKNQYRLAIRVQRVSLVKSSIVEDMVKKARGEADVRFVGRIAKRQDVPWYRGRVRPLQIGSSIGHYAITAGTLGAFVTRGRAKTLYILSNNHVLANEDAGKRGDAVTQPGAYDDGKRPADAVGKLATWIKFKKSGRNLVDAALARVDAGIEADRSRLQGIGGSRGRLAGVGPGFLDEGTTVYKVGRTTGVTKGRVTAFDLDNVVVAYDVGNLTFDNQIEIEGTGRRPFSDGGDSGSLIVNEDHLAVALLFAGGDSGGSNGLGLTYANPISTVLKQLKARLALR
jgi:hypothetical protein